MKKSVPAPNPDAYVAALSGWQRSCVEGLRSTVRGSPDLVEAIKWGHLVYTSNGPVLLIRAEDQRVLFGFWRGKRLRHLDSRLKPGGKYEMATIELRAADTVSSTLLGRLIEEAIALNGSLGDPTDIGQ